MDFLIAGTILLTALAGCGRGLFQFEERAPWRHEAEVACLKSGEVNLGNGIVQIEAIDDPGVCGVDFPLKVAALGEYNSRLNFANGSPPESSSIQNGSMRWITGPAGIDRTHPDGTGAQPLLLRPPADVGMAPTDNQPIIGGGSTGSSIPVVLSPSATLACPMVSALERWVSDSLQPAALHWFGAPVVKIQQISSYTCRSMIGSGSSKISEHAFGNALDIAGFTLADGRTITVKDGWHGTPEEQGFLHDVQLHACNVFSTVLAPGSNAAHHDHIHIDLMRRTSGRSYCQPNTIPGEVVAAKARAKEADKARASAYSASTGTRSATPGETFAGEDGDIADDDAR